MKFKDNIQKQEYIDNYILGRLSQKENEEFKEQLKLDNELSDEVDMQRIFINELQKRGEFLNIVAGAEKKIQDKKKVTFYIRYSIAASFLILLSIGIWQPGNISNNAIYSGYMENPQISTQITRSTSNDIFQINLEGFSEEEQDLIRSAIVLFNQEDFTSVITNLNQVEKIVEKSNGAGLMLAVSEINQGNLKTAQEILNKLSESNEERIIQASLYYTGLVLVKEGKTREARRVFRRLADKTGIYPDKAKEILDKMRYF